MRSIKPSRPSRREYAKGGGSNRMFGEQAAGPAKPAITGKGQTPAPGAKSARGGSTHMASFSPARPAKAGKTAR
jgi:hypothetical protein